MVAVYKPQLPNKSFQLKILGPNGYARNVDLAEGQYTVGSEKNSDIILKHPSIASKYAVLTLGNGNLELRRLSDNKIYKTQYEKNEWVKCEDFYIQVPLSAENSKYFEPEDESRLQLSLAQTQDRLPSLPPSTQIKQPVQKKKIARKQATFKRNADGDIVDMVFDETSFKLSEVVPVEANEERFKDYVSVNDKSIRTILPNRKKAKSKVLEIIYMSYGNIVNFEFLPMQARYIDHLYNYVSRDLRNLLPNDSKWVSWKNGKPSFSTPRGWSQQVTKDEYGLDSEFRIYKGVNQIVVRQAQSLPGFILWLTWPGRAEFIQFLKIGVLFFLPFMILSLFDVPEQVAEVEIEQEVIIVKEVVATPTPEPTPEVKVAKEVPTPAPTVAPKVAEKPKPIPLPKIPKPQPIKQVVDKTPPKRLVVQQSPVVKVGGTGPQNPNAAAEAAARAQAKQLAQTKAKLSSSLGFISSGKGLLTVPDVPNQNNKFLGAKGLAGSSNVQGKNFLANITGKDGVGSSGGPINTTGSRNIASGPVVSDGEIYGSKNGKDLNYVQGKVSVSGLHSAGGSGSFGPAGGAMAVSGNIDQDAVRRAIEKYMSKIRYCYEKSLLSKPSLSGGLRMEWKVNPGGRAAGIKVLQSALNDATLHGCVSNVIATIPFPNPKGGPATVAYPFNFTPFQ